MKIAIAGGSGLIGKALSNSLSKKGHSVLILTRSESRGPISGNNIRYVPWLNKGNQPEKELENLDALVNLAGSTINSRWTDKGKELIVNSRLNTVDELAKIIQNLEVKPKVFINASAIGFYGTSEKQIYTEESTKPGTDFLADTVVKWESAVKQIEDMGLRTVFCRFGVILDVKEGALPRMVLPYRFFIGGTIGNGQQWLSWIHINDVVRGVLFAIENRQLTGPVNFTAPAPVRMKDFGRTLSRVIHRPHWLPVPNLALRLLLGEMSLLVLEGQKVLPSKLLNHGFSFQYPHLEAALEELFNK